jgi:integrase/recombinase XerD
MQRRRRKITEMSDIKIVDALKQFNDENRSKNLSSHTLDTYNIHINDFINRMGLKECSSSFLGIDMYIWYVEDLQEEGIKKDTTISSYCRSVRVFLYWLMENDYMESCTLTIPRYQKTIKATYTDEELITLLVKPEKNCTEVEYLTWVFINICISTGLRLSSILNLKVCDYNKSDKTLCVNYTKNNTVKLVYLNDEMAGILNKYISLFNLTNLDWFFSTGEGTQLKRRSIQDYVAKYNRKRGIEKTSIHLFRHTFSKNYYKRTKDIYSLCNILGHTTISTTENYLRDLGLSCEDSTVYNPQLEYIKKSKTKRRGKMSV